MMFSKRFGYALRGILYIAATGNEYKKIRVEDIARRIGIPQHFLGKIMNKIAKAGIVGAVKGPSGGFFLNNKTLDTPLIILFHLTDDSKLLDGCVLRLNKCNEEDSCPMHRFMSDNRKNILTMLNETTIGDLLKEETGDFIKSISIR
jgi:Rrf2 family iron-sulfur cluster assembly transcriptional regulator